MADRRIGGTDRESYVGVLSGRAERNVVKYLRHISIIFYPLLVYEWVLSSTTVFYSILGVIGGQCFPRFKGETLINQCFVPTAAQLYELWPGWVWEACQHLSLMLT